MVAARLAAQVHETVTARQEPWLELAVDAPSELAEVLAATLGEMADGIELRDPGTLLRAAPGRTIVVAHIDPERRAEALAAIDETVTRAREAGVAAGDVAVRERSAHEDEWRDVWKQFFRATRVGRSFIVRPSWDPGSVADGDRVIDLDPGRAFGTGGHATTRLVIRLAEAVADQRAESGGASIARFLDLGCGSGILSIAAARLWPDAAGVAVDVDPEATACSLENLARNRVPTVEVRTGGVDVLHDESPFDVVLANIQADVLGRIAGDLHRLVAPGGTVILSGLLTGDADPISAVYSLAGFAPVSRLDDEEWTGLSLQRR